MKKNNPIPYYPLVLVFLLAGSVFCEKDTIEITGETMEFRNKGTLTLYKDGVKITGDGYRVNAREAVADEKSGDVMIEGNIVAYYENAKGDKLKASAYGTRYNRNSRIGVLYGNPKMEIQSKEKEGEKVMVYADRITIYEKSDRVEAAGNVYVSNYALDVWADTGVYDQSLRELLLTGTNPFVAMVGEGSLDYFNSEKILVSIAGEKLSFDNNVKSILWGSLK
jgi:lipopolysaccharide export system protein LptA